MLWRAECQHPASHVGAAAVSYPQASHDTSSRIADDVHRRSAGILLDATGNLSQMFGLAPKITGAIAQRLHNYSRPASGTQPRGQRLKRLDVSPYPGTKRTGPGAVCETG